MSVALTGVWQHTKKNQIIFKKLLTKNRSMLHYY